MINVLITDITSYKAIVFAKALQMDNDVQVITSDYRNSSRFLRTKYSGKHYLYRSSQQDEAGFIADICDIIQKENIHFIIPINSKDIRVFLKNKDRLKGTLDYMGSYDSFVTLDNKKNLSELVKKFNFNYPKKYTFNDQIDKFPIVFKPTESSSSKGVKYIHSQAELEQLKKEIGGNKNYILQQFIEGQGVGFSVLAKDGSILYSCGHKREAEYPVSGGSSTIRSYFEHPECLPVAEKIIKETNWSGLAMFEFKLTDDNKVYLIEINPRVWGSINQSIQSGVNFPKLIVKHEKLQPLINQKTITFIAPLHLFSLLGYLMRGNFKPCIFFIRHFLSAKSDVSIIKDPGGFTSMLTRF